MDMFSSSSDLDLSVNFSDKIAMANRSMQTETLRKFTKKFYAMRDRGRVTNVRPILKARVPVVKVTACGSGVECDLSVGNLDGIAKSQIVLLISSIDERFQKLSFLMKAWAKAQKINSAVDGSLNSLSLILLAAFHLQTRDTPILPPFSAILKDGSNPDTVKEKIRFFMNYGENNNESLAELFVSLLVKLDSVDALWSEGLCASTFEGSWIDKKWNKKEGPGPGCISIEDFTDRSQNTSRALKLFLTHMKIYSRIRFSLNQIRLFTEGKIKSVKLIRLLFGKFPPATSKPSTMPTQGKRKRPNEKKKKQPPPGPSRKGQKFETSGNKTSASRRKTINGPSSLCLTSPTQPFQGSQSDILGLTALTVLAGQLISTPNSSIPGYGGIRPENLSYVTPPFMAGQPHHAPHYSTRGPGRYGSDRTHVEALVHATPQFSIGSSHSLPGSSFQGYGGVRPHRSHADGFSHGEPTFSMRTPSYFSNLPSQHYGGYRMDDNYRHADFRDPRSYTTIPPHHRHHPYPPSADRERWERPYTPWPSFPSFPPEYSNNTQQYENRRRFR
ncbi:uncharacterized protein LOC141587024 isoform X2 [Silene latifolia]